jgi:hypothetical protein
MSNMPTQLQASAPSNLTDSKPSFFDILPKELSDSIYDRLCQEHDDDFGGLRCQSHAICIELHLVSRQCKVKYDERTLVNEQLR